MNLFRDDPLPSLVEKNPEPTPDPKAQRVEATIARVRALSGKKLGGKTLYTSFRRIGTVECGKDERVPYASGMDECRVCDERFLRLLIDVYEEKASRKKGDSVCCERLAFMCCPHCGVFLREEDDAEHGDLFKVLEKLEEQYAPTRVSAGLLHSAEQRVERRRLEIALAEERYREAVEELEKLRELPVDLESYRTPSTPSST